MQLKKIGCKNFLSYTELDLTLSPNTLYAIVGENRDTNYANSNGAGKSALFDMVTFALFGYSHRGVLSNLIGPNDKTCEAEVVLSMGDKEIRVKREYGRLTKLKVWVNDKDVSTPYVNDTQTLLTNLLGISLSSFLLSTYTSADSVKRFGAATSTEKKQILDEILHMDFKVYQKYIKNKLKDFSDLSIKLNTQKQEKLNELTWIDNMLATNDQSHQVTIGAINVAEQDIKSAEKDVDRYNERFLAVKKQYDTIIEQGVALEKQIEGMNKRIKIIKEKNACPLCARKISQETRQKLLSLFVKKNTELQDKIDELYKQKQSLLEAYKKSNTERENAQTLYNKKKETLVALKSNAENKSESKELLLTRRETKKKEYDGAVNKLVEIHKKESLYNFWKVGFGSSGVKVLLQSSIIDFLNKRLSIYATTAIFNEGVNIYLTLEDNKLLLNIHKDGKDFLYEQLSGGERRRCDVAFLLSLRDAFASTTQVEFAFLDEIFDVIDKEGKDRILELLRNQENNTYLIITQDEETQNSFDHKILVTKQKGVSNAELNIT